MKRKKIKRKFKKKTLSKTANLTVFPATFAPIKIRVVGIGGGGSSIVSEISRSLKKASFVIADTDWRSLKKGSGIHKLHFGQNLTHGLGTGMNWELAKTAAENEREKIDKIFKGQDISILVASLGGGVGSGAAPVFAKEASLSKSLTLGIFTLPFKFEGASKLAVAKKAFESIKVHLNGSVAIPNERIFKVIDEKTPINAALSVVNKSLIESLQSLIEIIYNPGLINIDFADIRTILKEKNKLAFLNTVQAQGKNAAEIITKKIFHNPLYNYNLKPEKILFNISAGKNLSMIDVEKISRGIADSAPRAKIIFGISRNSKSKNKIKATLFVIGNSLFAVKAVKPVKPVKKEVHPVKFPKNNGVQPAKTEKKEEIKKASDEVKEKPTPVKPDPKEEKKIVKKLQDKSPSTLPNEAAGSVKLFSAPFKKNKQFNRIKIRRSALEIKREEKREEEEKLLQEKELEIPTFLRKIR